MRAASDGAGSESCDGAVGSDGRPRPARPIILSRGARRVAFLGDNALVIAKGEMDHRNLWAIDLGTGGERQLTNFDRGFVIDDFDISPDDREIIFERAQDTSDIVLVER